MKGRNTLYWITTLLLCAFMAFSAYAYLSREPQMMGNFASLGYPDYFPTILGTAKVLGLLVLLLPAIPLVKEWAYAGFTFTFIGAFWSHLVMHEEQQLLMPVVAMILLVASYKLRPASRRLLQFHPLASSAKVREFIRPQSRATVER
jgi:hypothetical protein